MRHIRVVACAVGLMAVITANVALAQAPPPMPKAGAEQQRLHYFAGNWKSEGEMKPGPFGPGGKFSSMDEAHMLGDFYVVTNSKGTGPMGPVTEVAIIGYDAKQKAYTYDDFNTIGQHEKATGNPSGKVWTWTSNEEFGGKKMLGKFVLTEVSATSYTFKFDTSTDNGKTWTNMMEGKSTKVK
jgi:hypothetical protein